MIQSPWDWFDRRMPRFPASLITVATLHHHPWQIARPKRNAALRSRRSPPASPVGLAIIQPSVAATAERLRWVMAQKNYQPRRGLNQG